MSKKILVLVHKLLEPNLEIPTSKIERDKTPWITEFDIATTLNKLGYSVDVLGIDNSLTKLIECLENKSYSIVFNLLEEFKSDTKMESKIVALMELYDQKYSGCNSKGLLIAKDKALSKKILKFHHLNSPNFFTLPKGKKKKLPKKLQFPLIVKCLFEEASFGIAKASIVKNEEKLMQRVDYIHSQLDQDAIIEEFIEGKEIYVGVMGQKNLKTLPPIELLFENTNSPEKEIYSRQAKWNEKYRERNGIKTKPAKLEKDLEQKIIKVCKKVYKVLNLSGYARIDLRIDKNNKVYILEANPNPNIAMDDEFAKAAKHMGTSYNELVESLIK